ncbi:hypothetical protein BaRGS_00004508 [Batillaria attramentaria]|uniref:Uncharacterized protein n=1 Tax=Batillaria attramentaria TaxID=370345 RepID=A0ABD0LYX2_9CAEN
MTLPTTTLPPPPPTRPLIRAFILLVVRAQWSVTLLGGGTDVARGLSVDLWLTGCKVQKDCRLDSVLTRSINTVLFKTGQRCFTHTACEFPAPALYKENLPISEYLLASCCSASHERKESCNTGHNIDTRRALQSWEAVLASCKSPEC